METILGIILSALLLYLAAMLLTRFKRKPKAQILHFKNNQAAFNYAKLSHMANFSSSQMSIGIVRDVIGENFEKQFVIELADTNEQKIVSGFNKKNSSQIHIGNLVYWGFIEMTDTNILDIQAIGHVLAIVSPEYNPNTAKWNIKKDLTK